MHFNVVVSKDAEQVGIVDSLQIRIKCETLASAWGGPQLSKSAMLQIFLLYGFTPRTVNDNNHF